ncbi:hypothetical protein [Prosthecobacter sp.]|jgi:hypothetical protein|uniref:hypothetical protein n=1 Tax=Prosthecobacter sp. TaxID=1965333 RepID=UPI003784D42A
MKPRIIALLLGAFAALHASETCDITDRKVISTHTSADPKDPANTSGRASRCCWMGG